MGRILEEIDADMVAGEDPSEFQRVHLVTTEIENLTRRINQLDRSLGFLCRWVSSPLLARLRAKSRRNEIEGAYLPSSAANTFQRDEIAGPYRDSSSATAAGEPKKITTAQELR
jgi:hypothetical protein